MLSYHDPVDVIAATPWTIAGTLYDAAGKIFDVTNCTLAWALLDPNGNPVPIPTASISKTDPVNGAIEVAVAKTDTALDPGRYTDALQVTEGASKDVFWVGNILVAANPFNV
jgi:hypothetical protein